MTIKPIDFEQKQNFLPLESFIPKDLETLIRKTQEKFFKTFENFFIGVRSPVLLVKELLKDKNDKKASTLRIKLLSEFDSLKNKDSSSYVQEVFSYVLGYFKSPKGSELTSEVVAEMTDQRFLSSLSSLPGYKHAVEQYPHIIEYCQNRSKEDGQKFLAALKMISYEEMESYIRENELFIDALTYERLTEPVEFVPIAPSTTINLKTAVQHLKNSQDPVKHPFTNEVIKSIVPSIDIQLDESSVKHQLIQQMLARVYEKDYEFFVEILKKFVKSVRTNQEGDISGRIEVIINIQNQIKALAPNTETDLINLLELAKDALTLIDLEERLIERNLLIEHLEFLNDEYSFASLFERVYLEKYAEKNLITKNDPDYIKKEEKLREGRFKLGLYYLNRYQEAIDFVALDEFKKLMLLKNTEDFPIKELKWEVIN